MEQTKFSGQNYSAFYYGVELDGRINYDKVKRLQNCCAKIIVCGASAYAREIDFKRFREIADSVKAILFVDIAHIAGLVLLVNIKVHSLMLML